MTPNVIISAIVIWNHYVGIKYSYLIHESMLGGRGVLATELDCDIIESDFEIHSRY